MMTQILPAIDMIGGRCVRLTKGDYDTEKVYHSSPVEMAKAFEDAGAKYIHLVDLDAAKGQGNNLQSIYDIAHQTSLAIEMGGGIRNRATLEQVFENGVSRAIIGSLAVKNPEEVFKWVQDFGTERIVIGTDVHNEYIATEGWYHTSDQHIDDFISAYMQAGATLFLCTDIAKDGMLQGLATDLYKRLMEKHPGIGLIASGGVAQLSDVEEVVEMGMYGVVVGKAIYEGKITLPALFGPLNIKSC
ncbi:MAG TPA: 1-(5-phosphoribosyl)-5-[(5-phosphoribosylamino)methylideneamino]imidazole-4-carboxamide isomerase [Saprospiraceae bacterium]|nr:1-(5-phosphoribosyl)-5-[(5-phosphoribosylamino)methylideneamino]imidazole-4-carboxamide isomerase [Saprospiraceae bacterium]HPN69377.1 1-(5-phosphoribosyl)-5-[(5-phosphoribosylamino)methylideneamino]imidazole-4-carboxamide isomerase [Saprospiraceae bacterium]